MAVRWTGVLEDDPQVGAGGIATLTLAAEGELYDVSVSGGHARWVVSTIEGGTLVEVIGKEATPNVVHALRVRPVALVTVVD